MLTRIKGHPTLKIGRVSSQRTSWLSPVLENFSLDQSQIDILSYAFDQVLKIDGQLVCHGTIIPPLFIDYGQTVQSGS